MQASPLLRYATLDNGLRIAYVDVGPREGPCILFLHGLANYLWVWKWIMAPLQAHTRCIAIDLPGNGLSSRGPYAYGMDFFSDTIEKVVQHFALNDLILAGHSMGGQIALHLALRRMPGLQKLLLFAPAGLEYYSPHEAHLFQTAIQLGNFLSLDEVHISQSIRASFFKQNKITEQIITDLNELIRHHDRRQYRRMLEACIDSMLKQQIFPSLNKIHYPTLILFGDKDQLIPNRYLHPVSTAEIARRGTAEMQQARAVVFPDCGHFVQIEAAADCHTEIMKFL